MVRKATPSVTQEAICAFIRKAGKPVTSIEIQTHFKLQGELLDRAMCQLLASGRVFAIISFNMIKFVSSPSQTKHKEV